MRLRNIPGADEAIAESTYVIQRPKEFRGKWNKVFGNNNPVHIEVGMGKGKFITQMAVRHPQVNYIGIERYTSVLLRAVQKRKDMEELPNLYYLCIDARELPEIFAEGEISKIYLNFSDPWPKERHARRRLPSKEFLNRYENILIKNGLVEFKTDNRELFEFGLDQAEIAGWHVTASTYDLHHEAKMAAGNVMTEYEEKFSKKGNPIYKMIIRCPDRC